MLMILYVLETSILLVGATLIRCGSYQLPIGEAVEVLILLVHIVHIAHIVHNYWCTLWLKILLVDIVHNRDGLLVRHQLSHVGVVRRSYMVDL